MSVNVRLLLLTSSLVACSNLPPVDDETIKLIISIQSAFCDYAPICSKEDLESVRELANGSIQIDITSVLDSLPVKPPVKPSIYCCGKCSCNQDCVQTDSCCPQMVTPEVTTRTYCIRPQLRPKHSSYTTASGKYLMLAGCSTSAEDMPYNDSTRLMCENPDGYDTLDVKVPVTDINVNITYVNRYCAFCNGRHENDLRYWRPQVSCIKEVLKEMTADNIVRQILNTKSCNMIYYTPSASYNIIQECKKYISSCNVTRKWSFHDPVLEQGCAAYSSLYNKQYRNVFCFLCNTDTIENCDEFKLSADIEPGFVSFSTLLRFIPKDTHQSERTDTRGTSMKCEDDQIYDVYKNICRNITCYPPREYIDGKCVGLFKKITGVRYRFFIKLEPLGEPCPGDILPLLVSINGLIKKWRDIMALPKLSYHVFLKATGVNQGDHLVLEYFLVQVDVNIHVKYSVKASFVDDFLALDNSTVTLEGWGLIDHAYFYTSFVVAELERVDGSFRNYSYMYDAIQGELLLQLNDDYFYGDKVNNGDWPLVEIMIPPKVCPLVGFSLSEINTEWFTWGISLKDINQNISIASFVRIPDQVLHNKTIFVCKVFFKDITETLTLRLSGLKTRSEVQNDSPQRILSLVCTCVSVVCSILTLTTYALFKKLRTQPGMNNIMLTLTLIVAQTLFQFGVGQVEYVTDWGCKVLGILVHFFWLMAIMWMNVCSLHMFRVFNFHSLREHSMGTSILKTTFAYTVYCIIVSVIPVATNITLSLIDDGNIGYGGRICYISRYRMVGFAFALPIGVIILINFSCFLSVIIIFSKMPHIDANSTKNRNFAKIYIKLSTITGLTWTFGFLFFLTGEDVLEYVFILLNAGIGVFIGLAFVFNKRVLNMYKSLLRPKRDMYSTPTGRSSMNEPTSYSNVVHS